MKAAQPLTKSSKRTVEQAPPPNGATATPAAPVPDGVDPATYLRQAGLEVIDKRPAGALWVVDGEPPSPALAGLRARGVRFVFAKNGGRSTHHRSAWFAR